MDLELFGKLALITGASKGIGRATAMVLAKEGCDLALVARNVAALNSTADDIRTQSRVAVRTIPAALMAYTKSLAKGAVKDGMRVVGINPGPVATDRLEVMLRGRAQTQFGDTSRWKELLSGTSFGRAATPEEIGSAVAFLASPRSAYTTGTILTIDGSPS